MNVSWPVSPCRSLPFRELNAGDVFLLSLQPRNNPPLFMKTRAVSITPDPGSPDELEYRNAVILEKGELISVSPDIPTFLIRGTYSVERILE